MSQLQPGMPAPEFTLSDADGKKVSLSDYAGGNVVVYFYPKAATPGCTTEACDFRDSLNSLQAANYDVIGISPGRRGGHPGLQRRRRPDLPAAVRS